MHVREETGKVGRASGPFGSSKQRSTPRDRARCRRPQARGAIDANRGAMEKAIGEPLRALELELESREGAYVATRVGPPASALACAEVAAVVGVQCGLDESPVIEVSVDGERFALCATFDSVEWRFSLASTARDRGAD